MIRLDILKEWSIKQTNKTCDNLTLSSSQNFGGTLLITYIKHDLYKEY